MSRGVDKPLAVGKEKTASCPASAAVQKLHVTAIDIHAEHLIALMRRPSGLENDFAAVVREVCFRVLATEGELSQVPEVEFGRRTGLLLWLLLSLQTDPAQRDTAD